MHQQISYRKSIVLVLGYILLYAVFSYLTRNIVIADNSFRPAMALLAIAASLHGSFVGFLVGFFGNVGVDLLDHQFWWNWSLGNGIAGLISGFLFFVPGYQPKEGEITSLHLVMFVILGITGNYVGLTLAALIDVATGGVPYEKAVFSWAIAPATVNILSVCTIGVAGLYGYGRYQKKKSVIPDAPEHR